MQCTLVKAQKARKKKAKAKKKAQAAAVAQGLLAFVVLMVAGICKLFC